MIFRRRVKHPWRLGVWIIEHVCSHCGHIHKQRPAHECKSCKRG